MLEYSVMNGFESVCSWTVVDADDGIKGGGSGGEGGVGARGGGGEGGRGDAFVIHNRELFTETILPKFFVHKNWRSFVSVVYILGELLCDFAERGCVSINQLSLNNNSHSSFIICVFQFYHSSSFQLSTHPNLFHRPTQQQKRHDN